MLAVEALEQLGGISRVAPIIALSSRQKLRTAVANGTITYEALNAAAEAWSHGNQEQVVAVARHATGKAANPFESALRGITVEEGYGFDPQFEIRVGSRTFRPDLVDPLNGIILEADSWGFHADKEAHERDCVRYSMLTAAGWRILRFTYDQVMFQRDYVVRCLAEVMLSAAA